jgi:nitronate monooxygenase
MCAPIWKRDGNVLDKPFLQNATLPYRHCRDRRSRNVFMSLDTPLTQLLNVRYPILLAAMDLVADARLTMAVSEAGGFGILGAGYGDPDWLEKELTTLMRLRGGRQVAFGIGFITWSLANRPELLDQALAAKPGAVWLSFGDPEPFVKKIKAAGALLICQVQTEAMARDAVSKGADIIVAQGTEAGGHGMSRGAFTLLPAVVDAVGQKVPVALSGGVADGRGLAAALMLGAQGVVLGTRFYASQEAAGHEDAKARIAAASGDETIRSTVFDVLRQNVWPTPYTGRCLINNQTRQWAGREIELFRQIDAESKRYEAARRGGDFDTAAVIAGESAGLITDVPTAAEIVRRIATQADELLTEADRSRHVRPGGRHGLSGAVAH